MIPDWAANPTAVPYADFGNPQSLNLYGYVRSNPLSTADVDGHCGVVCWVIVGLGAASAAYGIYNFKTKHDEEHKEAGAKQDSFFKDPSTAPIENLTAPVEADLNMVRDAGVLAIENMNPSQGAETTAGAVADIVGGQLNTVVIQSAVQSSQAAAQTAPPPPPPPAPSQPEGQPEDYGFYVAP